MKHATERTNIASRIMDLWDDYDPHTYYDACFDNGADEVRFELEHDPAQATDFLNEIMDEGTDAQASRAFAILDAIARLN